MKYRELFESCDRILESPTIKMFDRYLLVNDLKNFYLEAHNYIKDNIMSLPYEFENGLYNDYFIEETEADEVDPNKDGGSKSSSTSDDGWNKDNSGQFVYGNNFFKNMLKSIMNFFIRLWKGLTGLFATWFNADSVNNLARNRETISKSADNPSAVSAVMNNTSLSSIKQLHDAIAADPLLKMQFSSIENILNEILPIIGEVEEKKKEYYANESNWESIGQLRSLVVDSFREVAYMETLEIAPAYEGAKIRVFKYQAENKDGSNAPSNAYDSSGSKADDPQNYDEADLTKNILIKYINEILNSDEEYKQAKDTPAEGDKAASYAKTEKARSIITTFMNGKNIHGRPVLVRENFSIAEYENRINETKELIRVAMRTTKMSEAESKYYQNISSLVDTLMQSLIGVLESSIDSMEEMIKALKGNNLDGNVNDPDPHKAALASSNEAKRKAMVDEVKKVSGTLFNEGNISDEKIISYKGLLNKIANISGANKENKENIEKLKQMKGAALNDHPMPPIKFIGIGEILSDAILFLLMDDMKLNYHQFSSDDTKKVVNAVQPKGGENIANASTPKT